VSVVRRVQQRVPFLTGPRVVLVAIISAWATYFSLRSIDIHRGLGTSGYDVGLYDQGVWLLSRGRAPFVTLMGRNLFGDHASFILLLVVPIYWVWPSVNVLFVVQSLVVALGALPVFLVARRFLHSEWLSVVMAGCFLLHPAVGWTNLENYHPDSFLAFFIGMAIFAALDHRWRLYTVFVVLSLLVKEDVLLVVVPLGVWLMANRRWRIGFATIIGALSAAAFATLVVMRSLIGVPTRNAWRIPFGGVRNLAVETIERPGNVLEYLRSEARPFYLWQMLFPVAFVVARFPWVAAISGLVLFTNVLSTYWYQFHLEYHYSFIAVPAIVIGTVVAISRFGEQYRRRLVALVATTSVWACLMWGAVPIGRLVMPTSDDPIGRDPAPTWPADHPTAVDARELMARIPDGAPVSVLHSLAPHLTHRSLVYQFPTPFRVVLYGVDTSLEERRACLPTADQIEFVMLPKATDDQTLADWAVVAPDFRIEAENDGFWLYRRQSHDIRCVGGTLTVRP
jgi:uncharacterized membrane protein